MPCQWMDVASFRRFFTRIVTVSPSRQRNVGAGSEPFTVVAMRGLPVKLTADSPISRLNSVRSEEHTSELQSLMRISYAVFCLKKKKEKIRRNKIPPTYTHK